MSDILNVAAVPLDIAWADRDENLRNVEAVVSALRPDTDILVLPELFSTGFIQDSAVVSALAEPTSGPTISRVRKMAKESRTAIAGSFLCKVGESLYNRAFFIEPSGEEVYYDKRHLFSLSPEHKIFTPGISRPPVFRYLGWELSLIVCYDLRFPVWCRNPRNPAYDMMLVPANWPQSRGYAWHQLLVARSIENQAVYIGANRGGTDDYGDYDGMTLITDAMGKPFESSKPDTNIHYASPSLSEISRIRERLPFGKDADPFTL